MLKTSLLVLLTVSLSPLIAFAEPSIEIFSNQDNVGPLDGVLIYGTVSGVESYSTVNLTVTAPDGEIVYSPNITFDDDGNFKRVIHPTIPNFKPGIYTVVASHQDIQYTAQIQFVVSSKDLPSSHISEPLQSEIAKSKKASNMYIVTDAINGDTEINIQGKTIWTDRDVVLTVFSPSGNLITVAQVTPTLNGDFSTSIQIGGPMWKDDGIYTVTAHQGNSSELKDTVEVQLADGVVVPEFGAISILILAVAITSIVVLSAKSRQSIIAKF